MSFEIGGGPANRQNFREEYQIDPRGPFRMNPGRPRSNQQLQSLQNPPAAAINADITLPPSVSQDKMMRFNAQVDGKALLHDLDQKFESQDRMINYLISQLNSVDQTV
jgi:hypothetical protein